MAEPTEPTEPTEPLMLLELANVRSLRAALALAHAHAHGDLLVVDVVAPFPVDVAAPAGAARGIAGLALVGGVGGAGVSLAIEIWTSAFAYPLNVGGRPLLSIPAFIPLAFEGAVLCAALAIVAAFLWRASLPRLAHPAFHWPAIERASSDRFFIALATTTAEARASFERALAGAAPAIDVVASHTAAAISAARGAP